MMYSATKEEIALFFYLFLSYFNKSATYGSNARCLALLIAAETFLWYFKEVPVYLLGKILPCSFTNCNKKSASL